MSADPTVRSRRPTLAGALLSAVALCGGCSLLLHSDPSQCSSDTDCTARGPAFANHVCQAGTCVASSLVSEGGRDASGDGTIDSGADAVSKGREASTVDAGCQSNADCAPASTTHPEVACDKPSGACIQLTTDECPFVIGDFSGSLEPPLYFGAFSPFPSSAPTTDPDFMNYQLALNEFTTQGGIPAGPGVGLRMPVAIVCNNDNEPDVETGMSHLIGDLHVPAVVAALDSVTLRTVFVNDAFPNNVFVVNPFGADSTLTSLTTNGLLWHMLGQPSDAAPAYEAFFPHVEAYVRNPPAGSTVTPVGPTAPLRVASVTGNATVTLDLTAAVEKVLSFNGMSLQQNKAGCPSAPTCNYVNVEVQSFLSGAQSVDVSGAIATIAAFKPNVIISFASSEFDQLLQSYEIQLQSKYTSNPTPFYLIGPYNMGSSTLLTWVNNGTNPVTEGKRTRIAGVGVASATDTHVLDAYESRWLAQYPNGASALGHENLYDATYFAVYAIVGAGRVPTFTGTNAAQGMLRLLSGTSYDMGPSDMGNIFGALGAPNGTISLFGALGPPDFTISTGARIGAGSVYCIQRDADLTPSYAYDVMRVAPGDGGPPALSGTFSCYSGSCPDGGSCNL